MCLLYAEVVKEESNGCVDDESPKILSNILYLPSNALQYRKKIEKT